MASAFELSALALKAACPNNEMILDDRGLPGAYVRLPAQTLNELLTGGDSSVHPAFLVNGIQRESVLIGKYQGIVHGSRVYSLPGENPRTVITLDNYEKYCKNKGSGHHCITAAEWAFLALWSKKNGTLPYGNNASGKDTRESAYAAIPSMERDSDGRIQCVATGTGPLTWSHDGTMSGVWDLNGNVCEWVSGLRLVKGELQMIPYNNAADPACDTSATSSAWRAISARASSYNDLYLTPNGSGTTANSVKLDWVSSHWQWASSITDQSEDTRDGLFSATTAASGLSDFCKMYLRAMALLPEEGDTDYAADHFWASNGVEEQCAYRGGYWLTGEGAGVFYLNLNHLRTANNQIIGGRPAYVDL